MILILFWGASLSQGSPPESVKPIKIVLNDWSSQIVLSRATGLIFEQMGYAIKYIQMPIIDQWGALSRGVVTLQVEVWEGHYGQRFQPLCKTGIIVGLGNPRCKNPGRLVVSSVRGATVSRFTGLAGTELLRIYFFLRRVWG